MPASSVSQSNLNSRWVVLLIQHLVRPRAGTASKIIARGIAGSSTIENRRAEQKRFRLWPSCIPFGCAALVYHVLHALECEREERRVRQIQGTWWSFGQSVTVTSNQVNLASFSNPRENLRPGSQSVSRQAELVDLFYDLSILGCMPSPPFYQSGQTSRHDPLQPRLNTTRPSYCDSPEYGRNR